MAVHVKVIAGCYTAVGVLFVIAGLFMQFALQIIAGFVATSGEEGAEAGSAILGFAGVALTTILLTIAVPFFITAWGLWNLKPWSRIVGIILAVMCLFSIPIGTLLGVYAIVVLFQKETEKLFESPPSVTGR